MEKYLKNGWNWVHLLGSCVLTLTFTWYIALICGIVWECLDELNKRFNWNLWFFDPKGFDYRDLIMDTIGIILAIYLVGKI